MHWGVWFGQRCKHVSTIITFCTVPLGCTVQHCMPRLSHLVSPDFIPFPKAILILSQTSGEKEGSLAVFEGRVASVVDGA